MAKICVAMSGGVDSSVAALLLKEQGHEVLGISMRLYKSQYRQGSKGGCCTPRDMDDARRVCELLDIPYYLFDYEAEFKSRVIAPFVSDYLAGRTPNPCVRCNQEVKFDLLFKEARALGCDYLATGHYARVVKLEDGTFALHRAVDRKKDQTYFLFGLSQAELARLEFPLGELTKPEVRALAERHRLPVFDKPDSQEICFVAGGSYVDVVREQSGARAAGGEIRDAEGKVLSAHDGYFQYTVGQRKGLGALAPTPKYVLRVLPEERAVVVGDEAALYTHEAALVETRWTRKPAAGEELFVKLRHRHDGVRAEVELISETEARVRFAEPAKSVTPGQAAVFYQGEAAIGGGFLR